MAVTYNDYPQKSVDNAKKGIKLNAEQNNKCATNIGKQRAKDIVAKRGFSLSVLKRVFSYLSRAKEYYNPSDETACGTISYLLWGGESMRVWAKNKLNELEKEERQVSEQVEKGIRNKVKEHNDAVKDLKVDWNPKTTYAELLEVFERGIGAYKSNPSSVRPNVKSPEQWAYARVNSFLYALKNGKFRSGKHDTDLLPVNHPVKKQMKEENNIDMKKIDKRHIEKIEETETHYIIHYLKDEHEMMEEEEVEDIEEVEEVEEVKKDEDDDIYRNLKKQE